MTAREGEGQAEPGVVEGLRPAHLLLQGHGLPAAAGAREEEVPSPITLFFGQVPPDNPSKMKAGNLISDTAWTPKSV